MEVRQNQTEQHNRAGHILFEKAAKDEDLDKERLVGLREAAIKKAEKEAEKKVPLLFIVVIVFVIVFSSRCTREWCSRNNILLAM